MRAAVRSVRAGQPARLIVALPVGSPEGCAALRDEVDDLVCLYQPRLFFAVGQFYEHFEATEDREVQALLAEAARRRPRQAETTPDETRTP